LKIITIQRPELMAYFKKFIWMILIILISRDTHQFAATSSQTNLRLSNVSKLWKENKLLSLTTSIIKIMTSITKKSECSNFAKEISKGDPNTFNMSMTTFMISIHFHLMTVPLINRFHFSTWLKLSKIIQLKPILTLKILVTFYTGSFQQRVA
jgi:hypothetical protein